MFLLMPGISQLKFDAAIGARPPNTDRAAISCQGALLHSRNLAFLTPQLIKVLKVALGHFGLVFAAEYADFKVADLRVG